VAALFHTFNHALCKTLSFFAAGRLGQATGSHEISKLRGALRWAPVWGAGLFGSLLVLIGIAPSAVFMSEFQTIRAAFTSGRFWIGAFFIVTAGVVFVGMLGQTISLAWGDHDPARSGLRSRWYEVALVVAPLVVLVVLGLWMPVHLTGILEQAAAIIHGPAIVPAAPLSLEMVP
jgi:formate hydrogenlyase subunit 3/multisubunit Na+/H+ antiporter MnhD subunit